MYAYLVVLRLLTVILSNETTYTKRNRIKIASNSAYIIIIVIPIYFVDPSDNTDTTYSTHVSIWYVMSCISGKADSCKSEAIAPTFNSSANPTLTQFSGNSQEFIANLASTILSKYRQLS